MELGSINDKLVKNHQQAQIEKIMGKRTKDIAGIMGSDYYDEVIHRDNMAIIETGNEST